MGTGTTITGTRIGLGRAEGRQKSARNRKIVVDAVRETGETRVESETNVEKKGLVQLLLLLLLIHTFSVLSLQLKKLR